MGNQEIKQTTKGNKGGRDDRKGNILHKINLQEIIQYDTSLTIIDITTKIS